MHIHDCVKCLLVWSYSGSFSLLFGLNTERYDVYFHIQSECGKIQTRITPNMETVHAAHNSLVLRISLITLLIDSELVTGYALKEWHS